MEENKRIDIKTLLEIKDRFTPALIGAGSPGKMMLLTHQLYKAVEKSIPVIHAAKDSIDSFAYALAGHQIKINSLPLPTRTESKQIRFPRSRKKRIKLKWKKDKRNFMTFDIDYAIIYDKQKLNDSHNITTDDNFSSSKKWPWNESRLQGLTPID